MSCSSLRCFVCRRIWQHRRQAKASIASTTRTISRTADLPVEPPPPPLRPAAVPPRGSAVLCSSDGFDATTWRSDATTWRPAAAKSALSCSAEPADARKRAIPACIAASLSKGMVASTFTLPGVVMRLMPLGISIPAAIARTSTMRARTGVVKSSTVPLVVKRMLMAWEEMSGQAMAAY